jgi:hypothetical protein
MLKAVIFGVTRLYSLKKTVLMKNKVSSHKFSPFPKILVEFSPVLGILRNFRSVL